MAIMQRNKTFELSAFSFYALSFYDVHEGAGGEQGGYKDRKVDGGEQEDKESGKEANFYFPGLTPFFQKSYRLKEAAFRLSEIKRKNQDEKGKSMDFYPQD